MTKPERAEPFERLVDRATADVAVEEVPDLCSGEAVGRSLESLVDAIGNGVADAAAEEGGGGDGTVVPEGKGSLEMGQLDDRAAVESSVEGTEAQYLRFGTAGSCAPETWTVLAQGRVVVVPEFACGMVAAKEDLPSGLGPTRRRRLRPRAMTDSSSAPRFPPLRQASDAPARRPKTAVGRSRLWASVRWSDSASSR